MRVPEASKQENERLREARRRKAEELRRKDESEEQRTKRAEDEPKTPMGKKHRHEHDDRWRSVVTILLNCTPSVGMTGMYYAHVRCIYLHTYVRNMNCENAVQSTWIVN